MLDNHPTVGSLFSGIGGIDLGLERVGFRPAWFCERDEWCQKILHKHWPGVHCYGDIHDIDEHAPSVDVLAGGFPCQPVSVAGKRLAQDDPRWLWPEFWRLIRILRPRAALLENVPGLFSAGFGNILSDLAAGGYDAEWDCIPAAAVGAPHRRDRVFIIATYRPKQRSHMADGNDRGSRDEIRAGRDAVRNGGAVVADPMRVGRQGSGELVHASGSAKEKDRQAVGLVNGGIGNQWEPEPAVGRVAHGIPRRVDRLRGLGNAVVPQVAEVVGRRVMEILRGTRC
jgi:DNA (cytosine-5)-methyltransferase 1